MSLFSAIPIATIPSGLFSDQGFTNTWPIIFHVSFGAIFRSARLESSGILNKVVQQLKIEGINLKKSI